MSKSVTVVSRKMECIKAADEDIERALKYIGIEWQNTSSVLCVVDTGRLSASINYVTENFKGSPSTTRINKDRMKKTKNYLKPEDCVPHGTVKKNTVVVGTNVEYAEKIEDRDHFLRYGLEKNKRTFRDILKNELKGN